MFIPMLLFHIAIFVIIAMCLNYAYNMGARDRAHEIKRIRQFKKARREGRVSYVGQHPIIIPKPPKSESKENGTL